jgi:hypothetical protein
MKNKVILPIIVIILLGGYINAVPNLRRGER